MARNEAMRRMPAPAIELLGRDARDLVEADAPGRLIAHLRLDDAKLGWIDVSIRRVHASLAFDVETDGLTTRFRAGGHAFGIHASSDGRITILAGDVPLSVL